MSFVKTRVELEGIVQELIVEVPDVEAPPWDKDQKFNVVGKRLPKIDGFQRVTGQAVYAYDVQLPGMAHMKTLRSPFPHAQILGIDTSEAEKVPGVLGIVHAFNTPEMKFSADEMVFNKTVRYVGEEVAAVAATSELAALDAVNLIRVEYKPLPFVVDLREAIKPDAPKVWEKGNIAGGKPFVVRRGDVEKGFAEADVVLEDTFFTSTTHHASMEPHGSVVDWKPGQVTIYDSTQSVFRVQSSFAQLFKLPFSSVRVIMNFVGGGFGSKTGLGKYTVHAALLSQRIGRPVRAMLDRSEELISTGHRPATMQTIKLGAKKDGTLTALHLKAYCTTGAYLGRFARCGAPVRELYACPNCLTEEYTVYINTTVHSAMRGPGNTEGMFALEAMIDKLADKLGLDPLEVRRKNHTEIADQGSRDRIVYSSKGLLESYEMGARAIGWAENRRKTPGSDPGPVKRGVGMGSLIWGAGGGPPSAANVVVGNDGSVTVQSAFNDIGEGPKTIMAMIAAEEMTVPYESVKVVAGDTGGNPVDLGTFGSRVTPSLAPAVRNAAFDCRNKVLALAADLLEVPAAELRLQNGIIASTRNPQKRLPLAELARRASHPIVGTGFRGPNPQQFRINAFGAQFAEVEVDTRTGHVRVLRLAAAHDCGRAINPLLVESQINGGVSMGRGYALSEERVIDKNTGVILTNNYVEYKLPTAIDNPEVIPMIVEQVDLVSNNAGVKGMAEPPCIPTAPAIVAAIYNATGVWVNELPATPDRVLAALKAAGRA